MRAGRLAVTVAAMGLLVAGPARAANIPVTNFNDSGTGSLRAAIGIANNNGTNDSITLPAGVFNLTSGELPIAGEDLVIDGLPNATVIRSTGPFRVLHIINGGNQTDLSDLVITGGDVAANGGGILNDSASGPLDIGNSVVEGNRSTTGGVNVNAGGGGIYNDGGELTLQRSTVRNNVASATGSGGSNGGGGIHETGATGVTLLQSTVSRNSATVSGSNSGGGGVWTDQTPTVTTSTISGNSLNVSGAASTSGGAGLFTLSAGTVTHATVAGNASAFAGGGILNRGVGAVTLVNTILAGNSSSNCSGPIATNGNNLDSGTSCGLLTGQSSLDPKLGPLVDNGGNSPTHALLPGSPAISAADNGFCSSGSHDQRDVVRPVGSDCDLGAYEFDGLSVAQVPDCSPTGQIPLGMTAPPDNGVVAFHYRLDGAQHDIPTPGGGSGADTTLDIPEGRRTLEYWGEFTNDPDGERAHHLPEVLVDKTDPSVAIKSEQKRAIYVITRRATVDVNATDALSGLVGDPSANGERIGTRSRGKKSVAKTATDLCGNQSSATLPYRVLGPGLGIRAVLERLKGKVKVRRAGGASARAAQKGRGFVSLTQPREIPIGTLLDTRKGRVRLTSSRSKRATAIQDGQFFGGLFQVLQSRKKRAKGLTELRLKGSSFRRCRPQGKRANAALSRRAIRRLRAKVKGRFRTRGRFSAATVRGTTFTVTDRCDGTLTKVTRGRVAVRDFRLRKTVIVRAGKSYLARAPG